MLENEQSTGSEEPKQQVNPFEIIFKRMEMLESYLQQMNIYVTELSKVNNNGWENYEIWSKRISNEMKTSDKSEKEFDFSVKRSSGIII